jgi:hypothetical protein
VTLLLSLEREPWEAREGLGALSGVRYVASMP